MARRPSSLLAGKSDVDVSTTIFKAILYGSKSSTHYLNDAIMQNVYWDEGPLHETSNFIVSFR